jgi:hypothetical protein
VKLDSYDGLYQYQMRRIDVDNATETILVALNFTETRDYPFYDEDGNITSWLNHTSTLASQVFPDVNYDIARMEESPSRVHVVANIGKLVTVNLHPLLPFLMIDPSWWCRIVHHSICSEMASILAWCRWISTIINTKYDG